MKPQDWRLVPAAIVAWVGAWLGTSGVPPAVGILFAAAGVLLALTLWAAAGRHFWVLMMVVVLAMTYGSSFARATGLKSGVPAQLAEKGATATALVTLMGEPVLRVDGTRSLAVARAEVRQFSVGDQTYSTRQSVVIFASGALVEQFVKAEPGAVHEVRGTLAPADLSSPESLVIRARTLSPQLAAPGFLDNLVNGLRAGLRASTALSPVDQAALLPSLVVGDTSGITEQMDQNFKDTSLSHLMAVSGSNLSLMLVVLLALTRAVGVRGWWVRLVGIVGVALFVLVCRGEPSVVRAAAMGLVAVSAVGMGRGRRSMRNLAFAVLCLMLCDPWLSRSWGFSLSVAACSGIALWSPVWVESMAEWAPRWLAEALALPLAAQLATQPLITALSGQVSVVGVLANAVAGPFVGPATVLGLAAMCTSFLPWVPLLLGWLAGWCVQPIVWIAHWGSGLPSAAVAWPATPLGVVLSAVCVLAAGSLMIHALRRRVWTCLLLGVLVLATLVRPIVWGWPGEWQVVFCDVGQGDATVLNAGFHRAVLVDAGPDARDILQCLESLGIREIPLVVLTHFHADHMGGLAAVVERYRPEVMLVSPSAVPGPAALRAQTHARAAGVEVHSAASGEVRLVGDVRWTTVSAFDARISGPADEEQSRMENDSSVVGLAEVKGLRVLLPGDVEPLGQRRALAEANEYQLRLDAHVLKLPHHGSARQEPRFFDASGATLAVASAGENNDYGHPSRAAMDLATSQGMTIARTDAEGAIAVGLMDGTLIVSRSHT